MSKKKDVKVETGTSVLDTGAKEKEKDKHRRYSYGLIIYEDDPMFDIQYEALTAMNSAIWIRHDKDIWPDTVYNDDGTIKYEAGDYKKPHYHFLVKFKNGIALNALAKKVSCAENQIEFVKNFNSALKYLIHYGYDDKYQYSVEEVRSNSENLKLRFETLILDDTPEVRKVQQIQDMIETYDGYIELGVLGKSVQKANIWDAFRRNLTYFIRLVDNHNAKHFGAMNGQSDLDYGAYCSDRSKFDD